jgi:class 3 adenylate cyclase
MLDSGRHGGAPLSGAGANRVAAAAIVTPSSTAQVARAMLDTMAEHRLSTGQPLRCRIGIAVGAVICGVLGHLQPRFHVLGSGIRAAEKLEQTGRPDCVHARCGAVRSVGSTVWARARASAAPCDRLDPLCARVPARWRGAGFCERKRSVDGEMSMNRSG